MVEKREILKLLKMNFFTKKFLNAHRKILYQKLKKVRCAQKIEIPTPSLHLGPLNVQKTPFMVRLGDQELNVLVWAGMLKILGIGAGPMRDVHTEFGQNWSTSASGRTPTSVFPCKSEQS